MQKFQVFWTNQAKNDLFHIIEYIAVDSINTAKDKFDLIRDEATKLEMLPEKGRIIPELDRQNIHSYRELIISPWRLMYKIDQDKVYILAVIDGRRNIEDILLKRQLR